MHKMENSGLYDIGAMRLDYIWSGPPPSSEKPTIVLLHDGLGCAAMWRDFPDSLAQRTGLGVMAYSRAGYGKSSPCSLPRGPTTMHKEEGIDILPKVLDAANIEQAILVGHSDGGSISLIHAGVEKTPRIKAVVTLAAHVFNEDICVSKASEICWEFKNRKLRESLKKYHGDNVDCAFWGWNDLWLHEDFADWNIEEYLADITVPVLTIQGADDQYGTKSQVDAIVSQVSGAVEPLMIPDCNHVIHVEKPQIAIEAIGKFVESLG